MNENNTSLAIKYFSDNFSMDVLMENTKPLNKEEKLALYYFNSFIEISNVFDRLIRYETFFEKFYPPKESKISESEVVEYHLRSYIQDFYLLQERIKTITNKLTKDLKNYHISNHEDVKNALKHLPTIFYEKFNKITVDLRGEHVHVRSFTEFDLVKGKTLHSMIYDEEGIYNFDEKTKSIMGQKLKEVVNYSKDKHIKQSRKNSENLKEMKNWFSARFLYIFASLNGHKVQDLKF